MSYHAPIVLMVCYDKKTSYKNTADTHYPDYDGGGVDAAIVTNDGSHRAGTRNVMGKRI